MNFSLMYLLAPVASGAGGGASMPLISRLLSDEFLLKMGAPGELQQQCLLTLMTAC